MTTIDYNRHAPIGVEVGEISSEDLAAWETEQGYREYFKDRSMAELLAEDDGNRWLVEDLLSNTITFVYAKTETGKSTFVAGMLAALLNGETEFLGRRIEPRLRPERVGILATDGGSGRDYARALNTAGVDPSHLRFTSRRRLTEQDWEKFEDYVQFWNFDLVVVDHLGGAIRGKKNDDENIALVYDSLIRIAETGVPVVLVGHQSNRSDGENPQGSSDIEGMARWRVLLKREKGSTVTELVAQGNEYGHKIKMSYTIGPGHRFEPLTDEPPEQAEQATTEDVNRAVQRYVTTRLQGLTQGEAAAALVTAGVPVSVKTGQVLALETVKNGLGPNGRFGLRYDDVAAAWSVR